MVATFLAIMDIYARWLYVPLYRFRKGENPNYVPSGVMFIPSILFVIAAILLSHRALWIIAAACLAFDCLTFIYFLLCKRNKQTEEKI